MPRSIDPGQINVGTGLAGNDSVDTNALVNAGGGSAGLAAHIVDPSRAHGARAISLEDTGSYYTSDHVEGALEEIGFGGAGGRINGLIEGGTFTSVGLVVTLGTTFALLSGHGVDFTAATATLTDNTTNYLYIDPATNLLTATTTLPSLDADPLTLWEHVTVAGVITSSTDARFFAFNLDRKVPFTVRDGTDANARSEGAFVSFEAALWYLENYAASTGTNAVEKHRIIIRGQIPVTTGFTLPAIDGIILQGEGGDAGFHLTGGTTAITITSANCQIRDLLFTTDVGSATAVLSSSGNNFQVDNCDFESGAGIWNVAVASSGSTTGARITNCRMETLNYGIYLADPLADTFIENCRIEGDPTGTTGIVLFNGVPSLGEGAAVIRGCRINAYPTGIELSGDGNSIADTLILGATTGISFPSPGLGGEGNLSLDNVRITLSSTTGVTGVFYDGPRGRFSNCTITNPRTAWAAEVPVGIDHANSTGPLQVDNCRIEGFVNDAATAATGTGIALSGPNSSVRGCVLVDVGGGITTSALATHAKISSCTMQGVAGGISGVGVNLSVTNCTIECDATYGLSGILTTGSDNTRISNCQITSLRAPGSYTTEIIQGIHLQGANSLLSNCDVSGFYNSVSATGTGILIAGTGTRNKVQGCNISTCLTGIDVSGASNTDVQLNGVTIDSVATGVLVNGANCLISQATIELDGTIGVVGVDVTAESCKLSGSRIVSTTGATAVRAVNVGHLSVQDNTMVGGATGIHLAGVAATPLYRSQILDNCIGAVTTEGVLLSGAVLDSNISGNLVDCYVTALAENQTAVGIRVAISGTDVPLDNTISKNRIRRGTDGILVVGDIDNRPSGFQIHDNHIRYCGRAQNLGAVLPSFDTFPAAVAMSHCDDMSVQGNKIRKLGIMVDDLGVETLPTQGGVIDDSQSVGVFGWNSQCLSIHDNRITDLISSSGGLSYGIACLQQDSGVTAGSAFTVLDVSIQSNTISWAGGLVGNGAGFNGIRVSVDRGTDDATSDHFLIGATVDGNQVTNTQDAGVAVQGGEGSTLSNVSITNNRLFGTALDGTADLGSVYVTTVSGGGTTDPGVLEHIKINENTISSSGSQGIFVSGNRDGSMTDFQISHNTISTPTRNGILAETSSAGLVVGISDWTIQGNQITEWGQIAGSNRGIGVLDVSESSDSGIVRFSILDNQLTSSSATANVGAAVRMTATDRLLAFVDISGNQINHPDSADLTTYYAGLGISIGTTFVDAAIPAGIGAVTVSNNIVYTADNDAIRIATDSVALGLKVDSNYAVVDTGGAGRPLNIQFNWPVTNLLEAYTTCQILDNFCNGGVGGQLLVDGGGKLQDSRIAGNRFVTSTGMGFLVDIQDADNLTNQGVRDLDISGNVFRNTDSSGLELNLGADGSSPSERCQNIHVTDNQFQNCAQTLRSALFIRARAVMEGCIVARNVFEGCLTGIDSDTQCSIRVRGGSNLATRAVSNLQITDNQITECGGTGIRFDASATGATIFVAENVSISNNKIHTLLNTGIWVQLGSYSVVRGLQVDNNQLTDITGAAAGAGYGIFCDGPTTTFTNASFSGNTLDTVEVSPGIEVLLNSDVSNLSVSNNQMRMVSTVRADTRNECLRINGVQDAANVKVNFNSFLSCGTGSEQDTEDGTISVGVGNGVDALLGLEVLGNQLQACGGYGIAVFNAATLGEFYGVNVSDNHIMGQINGGIMVDFTDAGNAGVQGLFIENNTIDDVGEALTDAGIFLYLPDNDTATGVHIRGNHIRIVDGDSTGGIIIENQNAIFLMDIEGNTIDGQGGMDADAIVINSSASEPIVSFDSVSITRNKVYSPASVCFNLELFRAVRHFQFIGNVAVNGTTNVQVDFGAAPSAGSGNSIMFYHNVATGGTAIDTTLAGTNVPNTVGAPGAGWMCAYNVSSGNPIASSTDGWGSVGVGGFCEDWDQGENNEDNV